MKDKNCRTLTGGGPPLPKKDGPCEMDWVIKDLLPNEFVKDDNDFDDDGQRDFENEEANTNILNIENDNIIFNIEDKSATIEDVDVHKFIAEAEVMPLASDVDSFGKTENLAKNQNNNNSKRTIAEPENIYNLDKNHKKLKRSISNARRMTVYETELIALHEARIGQQIQFEEERHRAQLRVLEEEFKYWKTKRMMEEEKQDNDRNMNP